MEHKVWLRLSGVFPITEEIRRGVREGEKGGRRKKSLSDLSPSPSNCYHLVKPTHTHTHTHTHHIGLTFTRTCRGLEEKEEEEEEKEEEEEEEKEEEEEEEKEEEEEAGKKCSSSFLSGVVSLSDAASTLSNDDDAGKRQGLSFEWFFCPLYFLGYCAEKRGRTINLAK